VTGCVVGLAWSALACGGVATRTEPEREVPFEPPPSDDETRLPSAGGTGSGHPGLANGGAAVVVGDAGSGLVGSAGEPNVYGGGAGPLQGDDSQCTSPITRELSPFVSLEPDTGLSVQTQLALTRRALIGEWHGVVTTPWVPQYQVTASFRDDGTYSAKCDVHSDANDGGCCRAFYYGSDLDSELKRWSVSSVNADGSVSGDLNVAFCYDDCYLPAWQGKLRNVHGDESGQRIRFEFWSDDHGPIAFDLERE
jgi:hypothetical protein